MGMNYYVTQQEPCLCCKRPYPKLHVGKSSSGWCFGLHVYPDKNIHNLEDWKPILESEKIQDESGNHVTYEEMLSCITNRKSAQLPNPMNDPFYLDLDDFLKKNNAVIGPNNLLRGKIDANHCIAHGEGTWDLIVGDFS